MNEPILEFVITRLLASRGKWPSVAQGSGVPLRTLEKIARRETEDPRVSSVQQLHDYFRASESGEAA